MKHTSVILVSVCVAFFGCSSSTPAPGTDGGGIRLMDGGDRDAGTIRLMDGSGPPATDGGGLTRTDAGNTMGVDCMGMTCASDEQCCVEMAGGGAAASCIPATDTCGGAAVDCDGPEDCGGDDYCCGRLAGGGVAIACESPTSCVPGMFGPFELCHTPSDCATPGVMCCPVMMGGFSGGYCGATCPF